MKVEFSETIHAPVDQVFDAFDNEEKLKKINEPFSTELGRRTMDATEGRDFHQKVGPIELTGQIIAYRKPVLLSLGLTSGKLHGALHYHFEEIDSNNTNLRAELEVFEGGRMQTLLIKGITPLINRALPNHLKNIKANVESTVE